MSDIQPAGYPLGVIVTNEAIYALALATHADVTSLKIRVEDLGDHETRLRHLERWMWRISGAAAAIGGVVGGIAGAVAAVVGGQ